jgi:hypothetical protein
MFGTCQWKDPQKVILGNRCMRQVSSFSSITGSYVFSNKGMYDSSWTGFCGRNAYYNQTNINDPTAANGAARLTLWQGACVEGVCLECDEVDTTCNSHRICIDGFWTRKSGNSLQGKLTSGNNDDVTKKLDSQNDVNSGVLAFTIIITILVALGLFCMFGKNIKGFNFRRGAKVSPAAEPAGQQKTV